MKNSLQNILLALVIIFTGCSSGKAFDAQESDGKTLIILGFPATEQGLPTPLLKKRLDLALDIYEREKIGHIIVTGGAVRNKYTEAEVMKEYLIANGVENSRIITETNSSSTFENALRSRRIMKKLRLSNPIIVTSPEHRERASKLFSIFYRSFTMAE